MRQGSAMRAAGRQSSGALAAGQADPPAEGHAPDQLSLALLAVCSGGIKGSGSGDVQVAADRLSVAHERLVGPRRTGGRGRRHWRRRRLRRAGRRAGRRAARVAGGPHLSRVWRQHPAGGQSLPLRAGAVHFQGPKQQSQQPVLPGCVCTALVWPRPTHLAQEASKGVAGRQRPAKAHVRVAFLPRVVPRAGVVWSLADEQIIGRLRQGQRAVVAVPGQGVLQSVGVMPV